VFASFLKTRRVKSSECLLKSHSLESKIPSGDF
jgi:hypothetical protein